MFDKFRRDIDASGMMAGLDAFNEQAFGILTSSKLLEALDVEKEDPKTRERYGKGTKGNKTRKNKRTTKYIVRSRHGKAAQG